MAAFNDRRTGKDRRHGDRRWLGNMIGQKTDYDKRGNERRFNKERRDKHNFMNNIGF